MKINRKLTVCDKVFRVGDDTTPEVSKVRVYRGYGGITSGDREKSDAYQKFLSRARKRS